jgi:hypothetical protein
MKLRVARTSLMTTPDQNTERWVTSIKSTGYRGDHMNKQQFLAYIDHFNNKRYDAVVGYCAYDVTVEYFTKLSAPQKFPKTLHGRQAFMDSYKSLHKHVREVLELGDFMADQDLVFAELYNEFHCFKDYPATAF